MQRLYNKNISVLVVCQALFFMCNTIVISTAPLVGLQYAPDPALATVPLGAQFLGTMAATMPASLLMKRFGRRPGLAFGMIFGVLAGLLGWHAIEAGSFLLFCLSGVLYGTFSAFCQYLRFTAADAADASFTDDLAARRARAIALVMAGGVVAAVLGPEIAKATRELFAPVMFSGSYLAVALLSVASAAAIMVLALPQPSIAEQTAAGRPIGVIMRQPAAMVAVLAALVGYVTMNLLMVATPLAMLACGHAFADSAFVIQWHVVGMFVPSFFTGRLIARFGVRPIILTGVAINVLCVGIAFSGLELAHFAASLFLLGIGWNFLFLGGTTLLTSCHTPAEKAKVQGINDLLVFSSVAASASFSGLLHELVGWHVMNLLALPGLILVAALVILHQRSRPATSPA
ncbi:MFS transporter [Marinimicrococcus flavescens]|uniref:MFS transporter n=1 Tax=Marinimicrococcus flavescens TaxID=3031815 RepID=A0AAP3XQE0_9PROT|nr:MFS transporter [Marinimicrococcus flavescens]